MTPKSRILHDLNRSAACSVPHSSGTARLSRRAEAEGNVIKCREIEGGNIDRV